MTLPERGNYDYCPVCWWEDEGQDDPYAHEFWYGPNRTSLSVARANYLRIGACDEYSLPKVRPPRPDEMPG
jgi:hypothetical protein